jgi:hypothetical protein
MTKNSVPPTSKEVVVPRRARGIRCRADGAVSLVRAGSAMDGPESSLTQHVGD